MDASFLPALLCSVPLVAADPVPQVIAHRGASADAPENTLAAFRRAWQLGADGIEGDLRLTADGHLVCMHDPSTRRVAGADLNIARSTLAELQRLDVGRHHGAPWAGERIPTLQDVRATVPDGKLLFLEVKSGPGTVEPLRHAIAQSALQPRQVAVISFNQTTVARSKAAMPGIKALWLVEFRKDKESGAVLPELADVLQTLEQTGADGLDANSATPDLARALRAAAKELHVWTVNDPVAVPRLRALGVASITTDRPGVIRAVLRDPDGAGGPAGLDWP